jgi:prepilin-type N-terminal cleavage/methylation domain-containing protein
MLNYEFIARRKARAAGFSLIELMIVVAVILIIAALAVPQLLRARMAANESAAASALRTLATQEANYNSAWGSGFSPTLASMGPPPPGTPASATTADLIDQVFASGIRGGYQFLYTPLIPSGGATPTGYTVNANPISTGITGNWFFYLDQSNVIRQNYGSTASLASPPLNR